MEDNSCLPDCSDDNVLSFNDVMFRVGKFRQVVNKACIKGEIDAFISALKYCGVVEVNTTKPTANNSTAPASQIREQVKEGIDCELLKLGAIGWQKGKVKIRFSVDYCPDKPVIEETPESMEMEIAQLKSPLDDIRRSGLAKD